VGIIKTITMLISLDGSLHFYDASHLNQEGVELFNEAM